LFFSYFTILPFNYLIILNTHARIKEKKIKTIHATVANHHDSTKPEIY